MSRRFYKMTGSGNDFVFLDARDHRLDDWPASRIQAVCHRRQGVGADGIVLIGPDRGGAGTEADDRRRRVRMIYFNADGSRAEMCGNAALCSTRLAVQLGLADSARVELATDAGLLESRCVGPGWSAELKFPTAPVPIAVEVATEPGERAVFQGTVGVPHTIVLVDDARQVDVVRRGRELRFAPAFAPAGSNINFVGKDGSDEAEWLIRTYERGVEDETLACGTGTIAAALAFAGHGLGSLPVRIRSGSGRVYSVSGSLIGEQASDVWLAGEGRLVFTGELSE